MECLDLENQIKYHKIRIELIAAGECKEIDFSRFREQLFISGHMKGRYLITGENGSGKSSLLKLVKSSIKDSILIAPGVGFIEDVNGSTGEQQMQQINFAVAQNIKLLLLDEWDANLDKANVQIINEIIQDYAERILILEVRHSR